MLALERIDYSQWEQQQRSHLDSRAHYRPQLRQVERQNPSITASITACCARYAHDGASMPPKHGIAHFPLFVNNELREAVDGATIDIEDPATGASIATCATAGPSRRRRGGGRRQSRVAGLARCRGQEAGNNPTQSRARAAKAVRRAV